MLVNANTSFMVGSSSWKNQFIEALAVDDIDGGRYPSIVAHICANPGWKWFELAGLVTATFLMRLLIYLTRLYCKKFLKKRRKIKIFERSEWYWKSIVSRK